MLISFISKIVSVAFQNLDGSKKIFDIFFLSKINEEKKQIINLTNVKIYEVNKLINQMNEQIMTLKSVPLLKSFLKDFQNLNYISYLSVPDVANSGSESFITLEKLEEVLNLQNYSKYNVFLICAFFVFFVIFSLACFVIKFIHIVFAFTQKKYRYAFLLFLGFFIPGINLFYFSYKVMNK